MGDKQLASIRAALWSVPFAAVSFAALAATANSVRPLRGNWAVELFGFLGIFLSELPLHHLALQAAVAAAFVRLTPALSSPLGRAAAAASVANMLLLFHLWSQWFPTLSVMRNALAGFGVPATTATTTTTATTATTTPSAPALLSATDVYKSMFKPMSVIESNVRREKNISFQDGKHGRAGLMDWYHHVTPQRNSPALIFIHGGGWMTGVKEHPSGVALLAKMAALGWSCFSVNYRLAPRARFPASIVDVKTAIAFIRNNSERFFVDPSFICLTGGSAGGHLSALATVTANDVRYQRGFELCDTSVQACVPFYGVYQMDYDEVSSPPDNDGDEQHDGDDSNNNNNNNNNNNKQKKKGDVNLLRLPPNFSLFRETNSTLKQSLSNDAHYANQKKRFRTVWRNIHRRGATPQEQALAIPSVRVQQQQQQQQQKQQQKQQGLPPFFIIHGSNDTLVNPQQSRVFRTELEAAGARVALAEIPYAAHAFDAIQSLKTKIVLNAVCQWLLYVRQQHLLALPSPASPLSVAKPSL